VATVSLTTAAVVRLKSQHLTPKPDSVSGSVQWRPWEAPHVHGMFTNRPQISDISQYLSQTVPFRIWQEIAIFTLWTCRGMSANAVSRNRLF
jgi:hypothetical protein